MKPLYTKNGLLYRDGKPLSVEEADLEARCVGLPHAEMLVKRLEEDAVLFFERYRDWLIDLGWTPPTE